jgi:UDP-N-acetylmuramoylalanine--D-glutamate ligase
MAAPPPLRVESSLAGRAVLVVGMARSGQAAARLALARGATVHCVDLREDATVVPGTTQRYGPHETADFERADVVVVSPGVPTRTPWLAKARAAGATVVGELAFAAEVAHLAGIQIYAVTGTNGKSSTVWFTGQLLAAAGVDAWVGGNLGPPVSELALDLLEDDMRYDVAIVEVSSYQLELPGGFMPFGGAILNLTPDHLARHGTMQAYASAKLRLFENMIEGCFAMLPADAPWAEGLELGELVLRMPIGALPGVLVTDDAVEVQTRAGAEVQRFSLDGFGLPGRHNRENLAVAIVLARAAGAGAIDVSVVRALPHRLEPVHQQAGVTWVNDSKATNVEAAQTGIEALTGPALVLLGGAGKDGADYAALLPGLRAHARRVICFGASGQDIAAALPLPGTHLLEGGLQAAVHDARAHARPGDTILLSPACASFDEFRNFEHRGEVFADLARGGQP